MWLEPSTTSPFATCLQNVRQWLMRLQQRQRPPKPPPALLPKPPPALLPKPLPALLPKPLHALLPKLLHALLPKLLRALRRRLSRLRSRPPLLLPRRWLPLYASRSSPHRQWSWRRPLLLHRSQLPHRQ
jgi:hypothetical protein